MPDSPSPSRSSRAPWIVLSIAVVLIFGGLGAFIAFWFAQLNAPAPIPTIGAEATTPEPTRASLSKVNRLAVIHQGSIYTVDPDTGQTVSFQPRGEIPTASLVWSRDGSRLIYSQIDGTRSQLISAQPDGTDPIVLFEDDGAHAPFYLDGAPDDQHIAFLISQRANVELHIAELHRANSAQAVISGTSNYVSWSPDSRSLLLHIGGTNQDAFVGTYQLGDSQPTHVVTDPAPFQAPAWSPQGQQPWLFARHRTEHQNELIVSDGQAESRLTSFEEGVTFSWSPDGTRIAYALNSARSFLFEQLTVIDRQGQTPRVYHKGDVLAFFWSPDGSKLAYLTGAFVERGPVGGGGLRLAAPRIAQAPAALQVTWHVIDLKSERIIDLASFEPTDAFLFIIQYFDQFAQSIVLWSPDSRSLVYTGTPLVGQPGVYVIDTGDSRNEPRFIAPGEFAIWSWH